MINNKKFEKYFESKRTRHEEGCLSVTVTRRDATRLYRAERRLDWTRFLEVPNRTSRAHNSVNSRTKGPGKKKRDVGAIVSRACSLYFLCLDCRRPQYWSTREQCKDHGPIRRRSCIILLTCHRCVRRTTGGEDSSCSLSMAFRLRILCSSCIACMPMRL